MILRKPYAILIKHFKLIHAILAVLMGYLLYKTNVVVTFINDYIGSAQIKISSDKVNELFSPIFFVIISFTLIFTIVIMAVLRFKKKPIKFYIYNIITYIYTLVIYIVAFGLISELQHGLVDVKTLKLVSDFCGASLGIQIVALVIIVIRATGFDIKGFNFKEDLAELEIDEKDNEEFEVNVNIDTDKLKRNTKKKLRYAKYIYIENRFFINLIITGVAIFVTIFYLVNLNTYSKTYKKEETFKTNEFMMKTSESYITNTDYLGNVIDEEYDLVVIRLDLRRLYSKAIKLNTGRFILVANKNNYYHTVEYKDELKDLGNTYINTKISNTNFENFILVFKVYNKDITDKMQLRYTDTTGDVVKITVTPENLLTKEKSFSKKITEELVLNDSILKNTILKIDEIALSNSYKLDYKNCINENCYDSVEYVSVSASDNINKTLLKLNGYVKFDDSLPINKYQSLYSFIKEFGTIKYKIGNDLKIMSLKIKEIKPRKAKQENVYYLEVSNVLNEANSIILELNVRNKIYTYTLK